MKRLLVRGTNWLGDAVMTTPALMRLREKYPDTHIALLTPEKFAQIWSRHPAVDEVISFSPRDGVFATAGKLSGGRFDAALILPNSPRSALEVFLAGIPKRIGYARPWRNFFLTRPVASRAETVKMRKRTLSEIKALIGKSPEATISRPPEGETPSRAHQSHEYLYLAAALGANPELLPAKLVVMPEEVEAARQKFGLTAGPNPIYGLNAGAEYGPAKRWPVDRYIDAAKEILKRTNCTWILFGGKNDAEFANGIQSALGDGPGVFNVAGHTSLREMMSLMKLCRVFLTNDTGPMHVAAALDVPVVAIFGSTSPELTAPLAANASSVQILASNAPCSPCFLRECPIDFRCMNGIGIEPVVEAVLKRAGDGRTRAKTKEPNK
jgi:lipopolysaccharide heptosyltransferase II